MKSFARVIVLSAALCLGISNAALSFEINVASFGVVPEAMPYAVAMDRGFFKEAGVDVTDIRSSTGGSTGIRQLLAGNLIYAESTPSGVLAANAQGAGLKIISENIRTAASLVWVVMPNSKITSLKDLKGARIGYTAPQGTTQMLGLWLLQNQGLTLNDTKLVATGGFPPMLTALETGGIDVAVSVEPLTTLNAGKYRVLASATEIFPPVAANVGVTSAEAAREYPKEIRAILAARRRAVDFMTANPAEASVSIAKYYKIDRAVIEQVVRKMVEQGSVNGAQFYGRGDFHFQDFDNMAKAMEMVGLVKPGEKVDWSTMVDESFLADDLRSKK